VGGKREEGTLKVWNYETGKLHFEFNRIQDAVGTLAFINEGEYLVAGDPQGGIRFWDSKSGRFVRKFVDARRRAASFACSSDETRLAVGNIDGTVSFWSVSPRQLLHRIDAHESEVVGVCFIDGGKKLATVAEHESIRIWEAGLGTQLRELESNDEGIACLASNHEGKILLAGTDGGRVISWDATNFREIAQIQYGSAAIRNIAFNEDETRVFLSDGTNQIPVLRPRDLNRLMVLKARSNVSAIAIDGSETPLVSGAAEGQIRFWPAKSSLLELAP
jgi:WD40 repeat protein